MFGEGEVAWLEAESWQGRRGSATAQSRCAEVTSTAQQGRPTICVKAFSCVFISGVSLPLAVVFFSCWSWCARRAVLRVGKSQQTPQRLGWCCFALSTHHQAGDLWAQWCPEAAVGNSMPKPLNHAENSRKPSPGTGSPSNKHFGMEKHSGMSHL